MRKHQKGSKLDRKIPDSFEPGPAGATLTDSGNTITSRHARPDSWRDFQLLSTPRGAADPRRHGRTGGFKTDSSRAEESRRRATGSEPRYSHERTQLSCWLRRGTKTTQRSANRPPHRRRRTGAQRRKRVACPHVHAFPARPSVRGRTLRAF